MAEFNKELIKQDADWSKTSQGYKADTSGGDFLESMGNLFGQGVKAVDSIFKSVIRDEATQGVDEIRDAEIDKAIKAQYGYLGPAAASVPPEVTRGTERLKIAQQARATGEIGGSHYDLLLDLEARRLRARYPGYREHIDNVIQDLTGTTPANRAIQHLKTEIDKKSPEDTERKFQEHFALQHGGTVAKIVAGGTPIESIPTADLRKYNMQDQASDFEIKRKQAYYNLNEAALKNTQNMATKDFQGHMSTRFLDTAGAMSEQFGLSPEAMIEASKKLQADVAAGRATADQEQALTQQVNKFHSSMMKDLEDQLKTPIKLSDGSTSTYMALISLEDQNRIRKNHQEMIKSYTDPILSKDYGSLALNGMWLKAREDEVARKMYETELAPRLKVARNLIGDNTSAFLLGKNPTALEAVENFYKHNVLLESVTGGSGKNATDILKKLDSDMKAAGRTDESIAKVKKAFIDDVVAGLQDPKMPKEAKTNLLRSIFSENADARDFYRSASKEDRAVLYSKLMHPETTKMVFSELNKPEQDRYTNWVGMAFSQRQNEDVNTVNKFVVESGSPFGLKYDPTSQQFSVAIRPPVPGVPGGDPAVVRSQIEKVKNSLNSSIAGWKPVVEAMGWSPQQINEAIKGNFLRLGGVDVNALDKPTAKAPEGAGREPGGFTPMGVPIPQAKSPITQGLGETEPPSFQPNPRPTPPVRTEPAPLAPPIRRGEFNTRTNIAGRNPNVEQQGDQAPQFAPPGVFTTRTKPELNLPGWFTQTFTPGPETAPTSTLTPEDIAANGSQALRTRLIEVDKMPEGKAKNKAMDELLKDPEIQALTERIRQKTLEAIRRRNEVR